MSAFRVSYSESFSEKKFHFLITLVFFLITIYVAFGVHSYWTFDQDGIQYLNEGKEILKGNGKNVGLPDAPAIGTIIYAVLANVFGDGFSVMKAISVLSGTGIVFFSYYIARNIFDSKIALITQLFVAFNPWCGIFSIQAANELLPIFIITITLYSITKREFKTIDMIIIGSLLGLAFMIRAQTVIFLISFIAYLLVRNRNFFKNISLTGLIVIFFLVAASPLFFYNFATYGVLLDNDTNFYIGSHSTFRTLEWIDQLYDGIGKGVLYGITSDFDLFQKNYFYNLFYSIPSNLYHFDSNINSALVPVIPIISIFPIIGGIIYSFNLKYNKTNLYVLLISTSITVGTVLLIGDLSMHFFAIILVPIVCLGFLNIRNIQKNYLPLLIIPLIFSLFMAIIPIRSPQHFALIWIPLAVFSAIFFTKLIPQLYFKIKNTQGKIVNTRIPKSLKISIIGVIMIILLLNILFSTVFLVIKFNEVQFENFNELPSLVLNSKNHHGDVFETTQFLNDNYPNISNSYIMVSNIAYPYYLDAKWITVTWQEGSVNDSIENYLLRQNWKDWELYISNIHSNPMDRNDQYNPIPDYIIIPQNVSERYLIKHDFPIDILTDPTNSKIPSYIEHIFTSSAGTNVYKINR